MYCGSNTEVRITLCWSNATSSVMTSKCLTSVSGKLSRMFYAEFHCMCTYEEFHCAYIHSTIERHSSYTLWSCNFIHFLFHHLQAVCTEAGMFALRERRVHVTQEDFEMAVAKVMKKDTEKNMSLRKLWKWSSRLNSLSFHCIAEAVEACNCMLWTSSMCFRICCSMVNFQILRCTYDNMMLKSLIYWIG